MRTLLEQWFPQADILLEEAALQFILRFPYLLPLESLLQEARKHSMMLQRNAQGELVLSFAAIKMEDMEEEISKRSGCMLREYTKERYGNYDR